MDHQRNDNLQFRKKITWFSFVFSLLVIWIHAYNAELYLGGTAEMDFIYRLEHKIGDGLGQIAVPGFFMISGYLFYRDLTWENLGRKWQRRIRSVLVPYILWNFLYYLGYVIASRLPWVDAVVGKGVIPFRLDAAVDAVINYTYNYVFWYLFQLILLIMLAPVLYLCLKQFWSRCLFLLAVAGLVVADIRLPLVNADALLYYGMAASVALTAWGRQIVEMLPGEPQMKPPEMSPGEPQMKPPEMSPGEPQMKPLEMPPGEPQMKRPEMPRVKQLKKQLACGCGALVISACFYWLGMSRAWPAGLVACRLLAVAGWWLVIPAGKLPQTRSWMNHNFFLYAAHFALVRFINKAGAVLLPPAAFVPLLLYLAMPFLVLVIVAAAGGALKRLSPVIWSLLNGGR